MKTDIEFKGTPGPWEIGNGEFGKTTIVYCDNELGSSVADCSSTYSMLSIDERIANAQLIAAAPDLLDACQTFWELWQNSDMRPEDECHEVAAVIQLAMHKALGNTEKI